MQVVSFPARQARTHYRHGLRTLTYVTLDAANGGIIRNLNSDGVAVQAVAPLRQQQRVRLRFELRFPRLRIDGYGEVSWSNSSGQCGIRFVDLPARTRREISQWIFSDLLEGIARDSAYALVSQNPVVSIASKETAPKEIRPRETAAPENDGLIVSARVRPSIQPEALYARVEETTRFGESRHESLTEAAWESAPQENWLSRPLSGRTLAWLVDSLVMIAALLLFTLIFLAITHELPAWPFSVGAAMAGAAFIAATYWALFTAFGGSSLGVRLAQAASGLEEEHQPTRSRIPTSNPRAGLGGASAGS
ncbi:MAG: PilZ domain-containing protein [Candidatus Sulfotelmatobacter sp.]